MSVRQLAWRACYELLAARVPRAEWSFMNYGFTPLAPGSARLELDPDDEPDRLCIQLYRHTVGPVELRGRDVLEVGSGRGGGASFVHRYLGPRSTTGLDFSSRAIALCTRSRRSPGLTFVRGDAQAMPFRDSSFDVVINVESSHCYDSMEAFLAEVARVLRPGGQLLWADLRDRDGAAAVGRQFDSSGLSSVAREDITENVLAALRLDNARKLELMTAWIPRGFHRVFRPFAGLEGTRNYTGFQSGELRYLSARLSSTAPRSRSGAGI